MTRFDADTADERIDLVADLIAAHRERESAFCTVVAEPDSDEAAAPWVQFDARESLLNLDCTAEEVARLERFVTEVGGLTIAERTSPEDVDGTNVRLRARVDDRRIAQLVERCFREVYDRPASYHLWATEC
ncbi:MAG: hypothetical protein ABEJ67_06905 [Halanaeroarchaeum sp.]